MNGILYMLALVAVPWLVAWTIRDLGRPSDMWWPFDMQGDEVPPSPRGWRARRAASASRPGRTAAPPEPAAPPPAAPEPAGGIGRGRVPGGRSARRPGGHGHAVQSVKINSNS